MTSEITFPRREKKGSGSTLSLIVASDIGRQFRLVVAQALQPKWR